MADVVITAPHWWWVNIGWCSGLVPSGNKPMMTSSNRNIFRVTRPLWGESTGHRWIPLTKASDAELWCFLWSASERANTRDAGDLRRHPAHYDVTVTITLTKTDPDFCRHMACLGHNDLSRLGCYYTIGSPTITCASMHSKLANFLCPQPIS